jgi:microsomal prostaglandin-E synthase 2
MIKPVLLGRNVIDKSLIMASNRWIRLAAVAGTAALASGTYYGYVNYQRYQSISLSPASYIKSDNMQLAQLPPIKPTLKVEGPTKLPFDITLFQYCSCPFCCKSRAFLDYFGLNYNIVEVNPILRQQLKWSENYKKVPILLAYQGTSRDEVSSHENQDSDDAAKDKKIYQINDSSVIISSLGSYLLSRRKLQADATQKQQHNTTIDDLGRILINYQTVEMEDEDGKKRKEIPNRYFLMLGDISDLELKKREDNLAEERHWRDWTDRVLVHSLSPNIYRTMPEAIESFNNFSVMGKWDEHFSTFERLAAIYIGSAAMWLIGKRLKKRYALKDDVRESLYDNCRLWLKAIGKDRQFMGGERPNLADLSVFGVLSSIEGCAAFNDLLENTNIKPWYFAVKECCQSHVGRELVQSI